MAYFVYIIFSDKLSKYYVGSTENFEQRLNKHNAGGSKFTSIGVPWKTIKIIELENHSLAIQLEKKIKKRGIKRYLEDQQK